MLKSMLKTSDTDKEKDTKGQKKIFSKSNKSSS